MMHAVAMLPKKKGTPEVSLFVACTLLLEDRCGHLFYPALLELVRQLAHVDTPRHALLWIPSPRSMDLEEASTRSGW